MSIHMSVCKDIEMHTLRYVAQNERNGNFRFFTQLEWGSRIISSIMSSHANTLGTKLIFTLCLKAVYPPMAMWSLLYINGNIESLVHQLQYRVSCTSNNYFPVKYEVEM